ncbi:hypothetical protein AJ80_03239 [Polytolypa hystricis UAMH7299]|uniref:Signal recognition particle subunit SRP19 n=1 Tax=Polytolypa hystricis (strain UAMH7299) TaxID=1447883 RepID=A0A2B7YKT3_POLH7|nr:hypothetical protein AJ80_03239 [Polytolypa hystricis UAMH7299]
MSRHAQIEEVSDSDPEEMDPSDFDPRSLAQNHIISPRDIPSTTSSTARFSSSPQIHASSSPQQQPPPSSSSPSSYPPPAPPSPQQEIPRHYICLYPVYFDATRSRAEGRKVSKNLAVKNPLARDIVDAVQVLGLKVGFEPEKLHPKDWANPGRVRVGLKREDGTLTTSTVKNKHHLYIKVAQYLRAHPTTEDSPFRLLIRGLPVPEKPIPSPAAPRGWKIGSILPIHSPAMTGGGVSDNPFKEAMLEMQQQGMGGMPDMGGGEPKKKKEKKKGKA